ncbi:hypothetical protein CEUSTIGMA_g2393.t1 [Chlamydomonas eustigma]|uniref:Uncharacterized protein n=1 Tax=Chlamydomonas eustigma TaxID=1157962 RepID=A0A250WVU3_9CHLO|nr:hypothetical protein CEUSTIGMA_g2393.t1 [Chlamydomonas eustigma]|eukprot:GAX74947.1 hypothetical protein CEUSTIGMA_g2393.t1 [Chlamydomonas eustigma]
MTSYPITIIPGDNHYLAITGIVTIAMQLFCFAVAYLLQFDKLTDLAGSMNFLLIDLLTLCASGYYYPRQIMVSVLVGVSKIYLASYLFYRVLKRGHDSRFDEMRSRFWAFLVFWVFQMVWAWGVSLPVLFINSDPADPALCGWDWAGLAVFLVGLLFEVVGDLQKDAFRSNKANRREFMCNGLWSVSRHPNFFGEIAMWWGIFLIGVPVFISSASWGFATVVGPVLTMAILLFLSGMPTAEGDNQKRFLRDPEIRTRYMEYRNRTSPILPLPPFLYAALPLIIKRIFLLELPLYETDWSYSGEDELAKEAAESGEHHAA